MHHVTIRNVDSRIKAALEEQARSAGISQSEAARQALARGLGVRIPRRDLGGIGDALVGRDALGKVGWTEPAFSDDELDVLARAEHERSGAGGA